MPLTVDIYRPGNGWNYLRHKLPDSSTYDVLNVSDGFSHLAECFSGDTHSRIHRSPSPVVRQLQVGTIGWSEAVEASELLAQLGPDQEIIVDGCDEIGTWGLRYRHVKIPYPGHDCRLCGELVPIDLLSTHADAHLREPQASFSRKATTLRQLRVALGEAIPLTGGFPGFQKNLRSGLEAVEWRLYQLARIGS